MEREKRHPLIVRIVWCAIACTAGCSSAERKTPSSVSTASHVSISSSTNPVTNALPPDRPCGDALNAWDEDLPRKRQLEAEGEVVTADHAVLWFPKGTIQLEDASKLLGEYQRGIVAAKMKIGRPDWNHEGDQRIYFYLPDAQFISRAPGGNCTFIPLWRAKDRKVPWLHESLHLLLKSNKGDWLAGDMAKAEARMPLWLYEGLADALAIDISQAEGLEYYSPLIDVPVNQLNSLAAKCLKEAPSPEVLAAIGGQGKPKGLFGPERVKYALPFYSGSASFTRFIAQRHGYKPLLVAINDFERENETLERETGEPLDVMKAAWLKHIKY